mmetsp:Transcript_3714/g.8190  ORF Transcript_3714/g.8190 Transcript_3714/m.8190 type:complete len:223 (+) Transcript_3714:150-818(+)
MAQPKSAYLSLITSVFFTTAFILMWVGSIRCNFIKFTDVSGTSEPITREFGLWYYQFWSLIVNTDGNFIVKTCNSYPDSITLDGAWKAARAFCILTLIFAIVILTIKVIISCSFDPETALGGGGYWVTALYFVTGICQGLVLLFLSSKACNDNPLVAWKDVVFPDKCAISTGAQCCISAMVFWLAAGATSMMEQKALKEERNVDDNNEKFLNQPLNSSGTSV